MGYTPHVNTAGGVKGCTLHVQNVGGERDTPCTSFLLLVADFTDSLCGGKNFSVA
jgi:hypothetical protein